MRHGARCRLPRIARSLRPLLAFAVGIGLALALIVQVNARIRPVLLEFALARTANLITAAIDRAVAEQAVSYGELVTLERSQSGEIIALNSDLASANRLRTQLLEVALEALDGLELTKLELPLGTLLGWELLSGRGPLIKVKILYTGTASAEFENTFSAVGINQTQHQIVFCIDADICVLLPGRQVSRTVSTRVCVAETIIVGKVPETYLQIVQ